MLILWNTSSPKRVEDKRLCSIGRITATIQPPSTENHRFRQATSSSIFWRPLDQ